METVRRIEAHEWGKLKEFPDGIVPPFDKTAAIVAETPIGKWVGRIFLVAPVHLEGIWIDPSKRGNELMARLGHKAEEEAMKIGLKTLLAYGDGPEMEDYLERFGYKKLRWTVWQKELR